MINEGSISDSTGKAGSASYTTKTTKSSSTVDEGTSGYDTVSTKSVATSSSSSPSVNGGNSGSTIEYVTNTNSYSSPSGASTTIINRNVIPDSIPAVPYDESSTANTIIGSTNTVNKVYNSQTTSSGSNRTGLQATPADSSSASTVTSRTFINNQNVYGDLDLD